MHIDPFTLDPIQSTGFVWTDSQCLAREAEVLAQISVLIKRRGFQQDAENHRVWRKGDRKVVVCLVDDIRSASHDYETDLPYLFDRDTTVITDNFIGCPTLFTVINLPRSFFSIYYHDPQGEWEPDRDFCFSVNRIDDRRFKIMLELARVANLDRGYVNFNCQRDFFFDGYVPSMNELRSNFIERHAHLSDRNKERLDRTYNMLVPRMPLRNYELSHEQIHLRSKCNIVLESYGSDCSVAVSEKIFRALVLPAPWTLYCGHYAVSWLESMGFDCMSDMINHNHYDQLKEVEDKEHIFVWFTLKAVKETISVDHQRVRTRCIQASAHNKALLKQWQQRWPTDFQDWLLELDRTLASQ